MFANDQWRLEHATVDADEKKLSTEILRQITQGTNPIGEGGAVDVPIVITMGHGLGVKFTHKTVGDAFRALFTELVPSHKSAGAPPRSDSSEAVSGSSKSGVAIPIARRRARDAAS